MYLADLVRDHLGVASTYVHAPKHVTVGEPIVSDRRLLKWYAVHAPERAIPDEIDRLARRAFEPGGIDVTGLGFVVLHRCGSDFYFLLTATWRNENELWETVWFKDGERMAAFAPFPRPGPHVPTFCVWELVPVWHEQRAWLRFLVSKREVRDVEQWHADRYVGPA